MSANLALDKALLDEAVQIGGFGTKDATIDAALHEFVQKRQMKKVVDLFGKIDFDPDYDYKSERK